MPMKLSETTHMIYADVDEWCLTCDWPCSDAAERPAWMLRLYATTNSLFADFTSHLPLELSLFCGELPPDGEALFPWQLDLIDDLDEHNISAMLVGVLILPETIWADLKESLFRAAKEPGYVVRVRLETREFLEKPFEDGPKRSFKIVAFGFDLHHQKGNA